MRAAARTFSALSIVALSLTGYTLPAQTASAAHPPAVTQTTTLSFDVATVRPAAPLDMQKLAAEVQAGRMPKIGASVTASQADYTYVSMKELVAQAYGVKSYQVTGPDWLANQRYDITAKIPAGASKDDVPAMLQTLLKERFKLAAHQETQEHPALALVVGKGGPKLTEVPAPANVADDDAPLKPGEMKMQTSSGPARVTRNPDGSATINMGAKGSFVQKMDAANQTMRMEGKGLNMQGFADMLTQVMTVGGGNAKQVVDMTGLTGHYDVAIEFSLAEIIAMARSQGMAIPEPGGAAAATNKTGSPAEDASDPSGNMSVYQSVEKLGLKLEPRKAMVTQMIVDHAEKIPTEN